MHKKDVLLDGLFCAYLTKKSFKNVANFKYFRTTPTNRSRTQE